ncbi:MAG: GNAT family N-acetyltransferase [Bacteroidaceae bacterium]|nr:GNAT family N-acetyltransferase [Bacteroidaceae bacterium]MBR1541866.1 GNAT family N-acetyltransferase [Bacteroidaceae bacterium]
MTNPFFVGKLVRLRAVEPEDLEFLYQMENDPSLWSISNFTVPYSKATLRAYIENSMNDMFADRQLRLMICELSHDKPVGVIDISDFEPMHGRGEIGISLLVEERGKGYAAEALDLLCDYVFTFLHFKQLNAHILADNTASLNLLHRAGFTDCGLLKSWWRIGGEYHDMVLLQKIRKD